MITSVDTGDGRSPYELENMTEHPFNKLDGVLFEVAHQEEFAAYPQVAEALKRTSEGIYRQVKDDQDYFKGESPDHRIYNAIPDRTKLRPSRISVHPYSFALGYLDPQLSEMVAEAIAKKLGGLSEGQTLKQIEEADEVWQPHVSGRYGYDMLRWIAIPLRDSPKNPPLPNDGNDTIAPYPLVTIEKQFTYKEKRDGWRWGIGLQMRADVHEQTLDLPLQPSKFSAPAPQQPAT